MGMGCRGGVAVGMGCRGYGLAFGLTVAWVLVSAWWGCRGYGLLWLCRGMGCRGFAVVWVAVGLEHSEANRNEEREKKTEEREKKLK